MCSNCSGDYENPDATNGEDILEPIEDVLGTDLLQAFLAAAYSVYLTNNAALIGARASNENSRLLLGVLKGADKMGMDVYGEAPVTKKGEYFRNNCWYWRPLWDFVCRVCNDVLTEEDHNSGHYNDGYMIPVDKAIAISARLFVLLEEGKVADFEKKYMAELEAMPTEPCSQCAGTGVRPGGKEQFGEEWSKAVNGCNGCHGKGWVKPIATWYPFEENNVREFAEFAKESGGFRIS